MSRHGGEGHFHILSQRHGVETLEHRAVLIQMFGMISALPTMPPRRLATWNAAWREGGMEDAGQASEVWFFRKLGVAAPFPRGEGVQNGFEGWLSR